MRQRGAASDPLLCVTVLNDAGADRDDVLQTLHAQSLLQNIVILCSEAVTAKALASLEDLGFPLEVLFERETTLHSYWSQLTQYFGGHRKDTACRVLVVNTGSQLPGDSWGRFANSAVTEGCVYFPLSVRSPLSSIFKSSKHQPGLSPEVLDHWINRYATGATRDLPAPAGYTGLITLSIAEVPPRYVLTDAVFTDDRALKPIPLDEGLPLALRQATLARNPLTGLRHAMTELSSRAEQPPTVLKRSLPVRLHISHGWGGGLARWIDDFVQADLDARSLVLRPIGDRSAYGQTIALYDAEHPQVLLASRTLAMPIISTVEAHSEYQQFLAELIEEYSVNAVLVSSLIGHSLDVLGTDLPTILILHNFFPSCPAILATFEGPCVSCTPARMEECFAKNPLQQFFLVEGVQHWHRLRAAFAERLQLQRLQLVAPSASVVARLSLILNDESLSAAVIPHGLPSDQIRALADCREVPRRSSDRLLVLILGGQEAHKGGALVESLIATCAGQLDFLLLGFGDSLAVPASAYHVTVIETYTQQALPELISQHRPDLGLLLSTVPETFSYTLSELHCAAVPTVATRLGAFSDRISHAVTGWLVEPDVDSVRKQLLALDDRRDEIDAVHERLLSAMPRSAAQMVGDYLALLPASAQVAKQRPRDALMSNMRQEEVLLVDPEARFVDALVAFYRYTLRKASHSPRIPAFLKAWIASRG